MTWTNGPSRTNTKEWRKLRRQAQRQLPGWCQTCNSKEHLELDHIKPVSQGGTDTIENVQWLCHKCHNKKTQTEANAGRHGRYKRPTPRPLGKGHPHTKEKGTLT